MAAYLLVWNPRRTNFDDIEELSDKVKSGKSITFDWSSGNRKSIQKNDKVYLIRLGSEPKGIFGAGVVTKGSYQDDHWDSLKYKNGEKAWYIDAKYHLLLNPIKDKILSREVLDKHPFNKVHWNSQSSGIYIPDDIAAELDDALLKVTQRNDFDSLIDLEKYKKSYEKLEKTEQESVVQSRIGQGLFRFQLIEFWNSCAVTGCSLTELLKASHIKPWRVSSNTERLDVYNGLLLVPNLDTAFDRGLITFSNEGKIIISSQLDEEQAQILGINRNMKLRKVFKHHKKYLEYHRDKIFENN